MVSSIAQHVMQPTSSPSALTQCSMLNCACSLKYWYPSWRGKHPELSIRVSANVKKVRLTAQTEDKNIASYFNKLSDFKDLPPEQIYAADETGFDGDGARRATVLAPTNMQRPAQVQDSYREHTSLLHIGNAAGDSLPMIWVFKGKRGIDEEIVQQLPDDAAFGVQEKGYFIGDHFIQVLAHIDKHAVSVRPLLLIIDGAKGHLGVEAVEFAVQKQINILCLPSNLTHLLQVADIALFGPLKRYWKNECTALKQHRGRMGIPRDIRRSDIVPSLMRAWEKAMTKENLKAGFLRSGIYPYNPSAYKDSRKDAPVSITGFPLVITPVIRLIEESTAVSSIAECLPVTLSSPVKPNACSQCGQTPRKRTVKRTLSTKEGLLLTGAQARAELKEMEEERRRAEKEKEEKAAERAEKKRKRSVEEEEKQQRKREKAANNAAPITGEKRKREVRKSVKDAALSEASVSADKENLQPNISASPPLPPSPAAIEEKSASLPLPSPPPVPVLVSATRPPPAHKHGTRHALRAALPR